MVVFVLGVIVTVLVVVLLMVELELVGAVDNKAGHYSVSPGRQQAAGRVGQMGRERERERERERGYTCSGAGGRRPHERHQLRPTRANKRRNECGSSLCAGAGAKHSGRSGLGMGRRPLRNSLPPLLLGESHISTGQSQRVFQSHFLLPGALGQRR